MDAAEIVIREPEHHGRGMVLNFLGKGVRQARETADVHSHTEILTLDE